MAWEVMGGGDAYRVLVAKPEGKRPLRRPTRRTTLQQLVAMANDCDCPDKDGHVRL